MLKRFFSITKPGIIFGNAITVTGGFFLASRGVIDLGLFIATILGISLVIACGCVFNNYIDRDIDHIMQRTRNRVLVTGQMSPTSALFYASILGVLGLALLYVYTNHLTVSIALFGLFIYVVVYSLFLKRRSVYGTLVGSISGAVPPLVGYCAVTNSFDLGALILFVILSLWQMPHSYAIAIYRLSDYKAARVNVLPVKSSIYFTKIHMLIYTCAFVVATLMLSIYGYTGILYAGVELVMGILWLRLCILGFRVKDDRLWARKMFIFSIISVMILSLMMSIDVVATNI